METNHTLPFSIKLRHVFWIIFICIWFSGCTHNNPVPVLPEGYKVVCNSQGKYSVASDNWQSANEFDTSQEAIEWADYWNSIINIKADEWSECEDGL